LLNWFKGDVFSSQSAEIFEASVYILVFVKRIKSELCDMINFLPLLKGVDFLAPKGAKIMSVSQLRWKDVVEAKGAVNKSSFMEQGDSRFEWLFSKLADCVFSSSFRFSSTSHFLVNSNKKVTKEST